jgi:hypothetical protein
MILTRADDGATPPPRALAGHDKMIVAARDKKLEAVRENRKLKRPTTTRLYSLTSRQQGHSR